jgi:uncharacterized membrane protein YgcG
MFGQAKSRLIHLKPNTDGIQQLRGFVFDFEVAMSQPLLEFCYYAGFGEYPQLGFGYVEIREKEKEKEKSYGGGGGGQQYGGGGGQQYGGGGHHGQNRGYN